MAQDRVGYAAFAQWEVELAKGKAKGLIGRFGFTSSDQEDIEQELLLQIHLKRNTRETWTEVEASERTVMSRILDNFIRDLIDRLLAEKRREHLHTESLDKKLQGTREGEVVRYEDFLREEDAFAPPASPADALHAQLAVDSVLDAKKEFQKQVLTLLLEGYPVQEIARMLGVQRNKVRRTIGRVRKLLTENGLDKF